MGTNSLMANLEEDANRLAALALAEDGGRDLTTEVTITEPVSSTGAIEFRSPGVLAGTRYADAVASLCDCRIVWTRGEGSRIEDHEVVGRADGDLAAILRAERPLLNLLQRASGIASLTRRFVDAVKGLPCRVLHTRKTAPGLRTFDLNAVIAGGGSLHRTDLAQVVMVKDNHWKALARQGRSLESAVTDARSRGAQRIYVEVESETQLVLACAAGADRLLIDNQSPKTVERWALMARSAKPGMEVEATGGINLQNARDYAEARADFISIGALTHSVVAADIALEVT